VFHVEDIPALMNTDEFAVTGTLAGVTVRGIFDADHVVAEVGAAGMAACAPAFTLPTASVPAAPVGKALALPAGNFRIAEHRPDGTGVSALLLERTA
jgi:Phage Head-Tail Attachment.